MEREKLMRTRRGQCFRIEGSSYKLSGIGYGFCGMSVMVKEELSEKVAKIRWLGDSVMAFEENVLRLISGYAPQGGRQVWKTIFL